MYLNLLGGNTRDTCIPPHPHTRDPRDMSGVSRVRVCANVLKLFWGTQEPGERVRGSQEKQNF